MLIIPLIIPRNTHPMCNCSEKIDALIKTLGYELKIELEPIYGECNVKKIKIDEEEILILIKI